MFDQVLADYLATEYGTRRGDILPILLVVMTRLRLSGQREFPFDWFRCHIEPPTHFYRQDDGNWDLIYKYSADHIGMVDIRSGHFDGYARFCFCDAPTKFWSSLTEWDNQIAWSRNQTDIEQTLTGHRRQPAQ